jgi:hypothetical protein
MDLSAVIESLQRGFEQIPPIAIALGLLAGPTAALIVYRLMGAARRLQTSPEVEVAPLWVCHDCRSVNELRLARCYRCGADRDATYEIEVIVDQPARRPSTFEVPAGSPFAALGASAAASGRGPGTPVMGDRAAARDAVAAGPGRAVEVPRAPDAAPVGELAATVERRP